MLNKFWLSEKDMIPAVIYLFKDNNENTRAKCICE